MTPLIQTPRLYFRHFTVADAPLLIQLNTPNVLKYIPEEVLNTQEAAEKVINDIILPQYELYKIGRLAVHVKEDDRFIGWCGLKYLKDEDEIDLGYRFMEKEWGKGFATETAAASMQYGFEVRNLIQIVGRAHIDNIASQKVLEKIGLQFVEDKMEVDILHKIYALSYKEYMLQKKEGN